MLVLVIALPIPGDQLVYQKPPKEVLDILEAPAPPNLSVNPTRTYALMSDAERYPSIADVSAPMLRLAGMRINPRTNGLHLAGAQPRTDHRAPRRRREDSSNASAQCEG
jgi:hypothetical protein